MNSREAVNAVHGGQVVVCEPAEWPAIRTALQDFAARSLDHGDHLRAMIALNEVKRLDARFASGPPTTETP